MLWAACCLGFFGFLWAGEFTVNCAFDPSIHLTVQDLQVDAEVNPSSLRVRVKSSKTDPFHQGCFIYLGRGQITLSRPWAGGPVMHINCTLEPQWNPFWKFLGGYFSNRYQER